MKKQPRKPRQKANQHRTRSDVAAPRRAWTPPRKPHFEDVLATAGHAAVSARRALARFANAGRADFRRLARRVAPTELGLSLHRLRAEARAFSLPYSHDERQALLLLFLPFLLVASAIVVHQSVRTLQSYLTAVAIPDVEIAPVRPSLTAEMPPAPRLVAREAAPVRTALAPVRSESEARSLPGPSLTLTPSPMTAMTKSALAPEIVLEPSADNTALPQAVAASPAVAPAETRLALLAPAGDLHRSIRPLTPDPIDSFEADEGGKPIRAGICSIDDAKRTATPVSFVARDDAPQSLGAETFGLRLAQAAEAQVGAFVIYNDAYRSISYPMGDVNTLFGVCTDVIVRAYRALGLDLQALVHQARAGSGDTNIDQRRTEVLRRFFAKEGESLPVTTFPEDYRPGDIVTYYRPQNHRTRAHIAIVSSVTAPSGRLMIVHNRGWGPQLEDALFVDEITGHFRYRGPATTRNAARADNSGVSPVIGSAAPVLPASYPASRSPPRDARNP